FAETCRYATVTDTVIYPFAVVMNMDTWNALPADVQKVIDDLKIEQAEWTGNYMDNHVKDAVEWSKATYQVEFIELTQAQKQEWNALLDPIVEQYIRETSEKGLPARAIVDDIRALIARYAK
ncbi:MAG: C4-dicarboxylate ABC transporter substrate-binding protein, partial [Desulfobacterales bacterium]